MDLLRSLGIGVGVFLILLFSILAVLLYFVIKLSMNSGSNSSSSSDSSTKPVPQLSKLPDGTVITVPGTSFIYEIIDGMKSLFSIPLYNQFGNPAATSVTQDTVDGIISGNDIIGNGISYSSNGACLGAGNWGDDKVYMWPCDGNINKKWTLNKDGTLINNQRQHCLATGTGSSVLTTQCKPNATNQQWSYDGTLLKQGSNCLDSSLNMAACVNTNPAQKWTTL